MTDRATEKRVRAVEKRLGVTGNALEQLSDLDLFVAIGMVAEHLAAEGNADAAADLARYDLEEAAARAFYERPDVAGTCRLVLEPGVRWPYLCARARHDANHGGTGRDRRKARPNCGGRSSRPDAWRARDTEPAAPPDRSAWRVATGLTDDRRAGGAHGCATRIPS